MTPILLTVALLTSQGPPKIVRTLSHYSDYYEGRTMANGKKFSQEDPTIVAANDWPLGTELYLIYKGKKHKVKVQDRMSKKFTGIRIDCSSAVLEEVLGNKNGLTKGVEVGVVR